MSKIIIGIHGLGNKPPASLLANWWLKAIHEGLNRIGRPHRFLKFELVYWGHHIYKTPLDYNVTDPDNPLYIPDPYIPAVEQIPAKPPGLRRRLLDYLEKQFDNILFADDHVIDISGITDMVINHFFKDLHVYFATESAKGKIKPGKTHLAIQKTLSNMLHKHQGKKILLIAHSMGSIIAFDVLSKSDTKIRINTLVTLGSPLGIPAIKQKLLAERKGMHKLKTPESVRHKWYNFSDLEDRVAFDYDLSDDYLSNSLGVSSINREIQNDYVLRGERNPHKSYGYLRAVPVSQAIAEFLDDGLPRPVLWLQQAFNRLYNRLVRMP